MKIGVKDADRTGRRGAFFKQRLSSQQRLFAHVAFDVAALAVDGVERLRQFSRASGIVRQQTLNAQRHVGQAARCVDAGAQGKTKIEGGGGFHVAFCCRKQCGYAGLHHAAANAFETLRNQAAVVGIKLDHIGHRAQRHQRQ